MTAALTTSQVLSRAADYLERYGRHRGEFWPNSSHGRPYRPGVRCCPLGAIAVAMNPKAPRKAEVVRSPAAGALRDHLIAVYKAPDTSSQMVVAWWNDHYELSDDTIIATMRQAAQGVVTSVVG